MLDWLPKYDGKPIEHSHYDTGAMDYDSYAAPITARGQKIGSGVESNSILNSAN